MTTNVFSYTITRIKRNMIKRTFSIKNEITGMSNDAFLFKPSDMHYLSEIGLKYKRNLLIVCSISLTALYFKYILDKELKFSSFLGVSTGGTINFSDFQLPLLCLTLYLLLYYYTVIIRDSDKSYRVKHSNLFKLNEETKDDIAIIRKYRNYEWYSQIVYMPEYSEGLKKLAELCKLNCKKDESIIEILKEIRDLEIKNYEASLNAILSAQRLGTELKKNYAQNTLASIIADKVIPVIYAFITVILLLISIIFEYVKATV